MSKSIPTSSTNSLMVAAYCELMSVANMLFSYSLFLVPSYMFRWMMLTDLLLSSKSNTVENSR